MTSNGVSKGLLLATLFSACGALLYGLDNGWWATVIGLDTFNAAMGSQVGEGGTISLSTSQQSAGTGLAQAGVMIGCIFSAYFNKRFGRKISIVILSVTSIIGVLIQITATTSSGVVILTHNYSIDDKYRYWQLVVGRIINSIGAGLAANVVPTYQSELAPAKWRGAIVNLYQFVQVIGVIICTACVYALSERTNSISWQVPIALQFFAPICLLIGVGFLPESPRWLIWNDRSTEALRNLRRLHGSGYDAEAEIAELQAAFAAEKQMQKSSLHSVFQGSDLRRTLIATGMQCLQVAQGSAYMTNYIVLFLQSLGITDVFKIVMIVYVLYLVAIFGAFYLPDVVGRRPLLMGGALICGIALISVAAINAGVSPLTSAAQKAVVGLIFIWYFFFGLVWSPLTWITSAEVCSARAREATLTVATFSGFGVNLIISLVSPYIQNAGYGNLQGNIGFLWGAFTVVSIFFVFFFVPEMKGLSLEQLDYLFDHQVSAFRFAILS
ncbi:hypothetical protein GYMLUDRAFT_222243 [Collybiopsis luxurians FD-317 M1]|uniref:Major facilitator superfamily (MFS) profile domain-containing protein n=1 Tax=Collybiopsis luxurians FD-317 M1 TaxID=944289 RepID=A0A0D0BID6_9AGAR|nr:hypothetical protein GYMLUDRAFT_222243 [Collybiopsis luxurians FD-317 M1]